MSTTRCARCAAIRPIPRSVSSGRSPAVPMIAVTGAARPAAPPAIAAATSRIASVPASLCAKSTMIVRRPSRNRLSRPGDRSADGRKSRRPSATCSRVAPSARAPPAAASAFAMLCRARPPRATGRSATSSRACASAPSHSTSRPRSRTQASPPRPPVAREARRGARVHREVGHARPDPSRDARHERIVRVEHHQPVGPGHAAHRRLDLRELGERVDALEVEVVRGDVGEHARLVGLVAHAPQHQAAARGLQHRHVHVVPAQDRRRAARPGPVPGLHHALVHEDPVDWSWCRRGGRRRAGCG